MVRLSEYLKKKKIGTVLHMQKYLRVFVFLNDNFYFRFLCSLGYGCQCQMAPFLREELAFA